MTTILEEKERTSGLPLQAIVESLSAYGGVYLSWGKYGDRIPHFNVLVSLDDYRDVLGNIFGEGDRNKVDKLFPGGRYFQSESDDDKHYHFFFTKDHVVLNLIEGIIAEH